MKPAQRRTLAYDLALMVAVVLLSVVGAGSEELSKETVSEVFDKMLLAVKKGVDFFGEDYSSLNVDGLFGIRMCQGAMLTVVLDCRSGRLDCPEDLVKTLDHYIATMEDYSTKALSYIEAQDPAYYNKFVSTIDSPYVFNVSADTIGDTTGAEVGEDLFYNEVEGDRCFGMLMGTHVEDDGSKPPKCSVDLKCWTLMTKPHMKAYAITHQLLYFIIAEKTGCVRKVQELVYKYNNTTIRGLEKEFCQRIYLEALQEDSPSGVNELKQDLFLEQLLLCGLLGYREFYQLKWLRLVPSWQKSKGCYGMPSSMMRVEAELTRVQEDEKHLLELLTEEAKKLDPNPTSRKLLREKVMHGDCLSHKTGLAFGTLGVYLRYLINEMFALPPI